MRVIAGRFGGRSLQAPRGLSTRPTSDRVREALFQVLGDVTGLSVLDLYAGTGALGIESLSRGAARVVFVESGRSALACLRRNTQSLGIEDSCELLPLSVERARKAICARAPFHLVLCDPPWDQVGDAMLALGDLLGRGILGAGGRVVVEHRAGTELRVPAGFALLRERHRRWGDTGVSIFSAEE